MSMQDQIDAIEVNIESAKEFIALGKALERLNSNADFKKVFIEGYLKDEAVRLVHLKNSPEIDTPQMRENIEREIDGIGMVLSYLRTVFQRADWAEKAIEADIETISELRAGA